MLDPGLCSWIRCPLITTVSPPSRRLRSSRRFGETSPQPWRRRVGRSKNSSVSARMWHHSNPDSRPAQLGAARVCARWVELSPAPRSPSHWPRSFPRGGTSSRSWPPSRAASVRSLAIAGVWYFFSPWYTDVGYRPVQPVPYSHKLHVGELGLDCRYCHASVEISAVANVPPTQTCMNCHLLVKKDSEKLAPIRESAASGRPMRWIRVHKLPDYAYFTHNVARGGRHRLRHLPRPHRRDGNGHPDDAAQHELVPRLPPQPRSQQTPRLGGHQHEVDPSPGRPGARGAARRAHDRSIRRLTVRGATGEPDLLAKSRADRGAPRIPRRSRAGVPRRAPRSFPTGSPGAT